MAEKWGKVVVVIPALNEAENIGDLVWETWMQPILRENDSIVVVDNGSTDDTAAVAAEAGAIVVGESRRGYGAACAAGVAVASDADIIVFLDGDYSSLPVEIHRLLEPLQAGEADFVLGSRTRGTIEKGSMPPHQRFGNWLTSRLMQQLYRIDVTDLGPYRAISKEKLDALGMKEMTFGWPTEMMVKAARQQMRILEVPVSHHNRRAGKSKVSGTIRGSILAAYYILGVTFRYAF